MARPTKHAKLILPVAATLATAAAVVAVVGSSGAAAKTHHAAKPGGKGVVIGVKSAGSLGSILYAGSKKLTVYAFTKSACTGACAAAWPPVTTKGKPQAQGGARGSDLGTIKRSGGVEQVTYKGHALYFFAKDKDSSDAYGQNLEGFGGTWHVLGASGSDIMTKPKSGTTTTEKTPAPTPPPAPKMPPGEEKAGTTTWG
jgi:predicted lipoprotein with Yx(FWY)xxD motif